MTTWRHIALAVLTPLSVAEAQATGRHTAAAARLEAAGYAPAGDRRTFFREDALADVRLDARRTELRLGDTLIVLGVDYLPLTGPSEVPFPLSAGERNRPTTYGGVLGSPRAVAPSAVRGRTVIFLPPVAADGSPIYEVWRYPELFEPYYTTDSVSSIMVVGLDLMPSRAVDWFLGPHTSVRRRQGRIDLPPVIMVSRPLATMLIAYEYDNLAPGQLGVAQQGGFPVLVDLRFALAEQSTLPAARTVIGERVAARGAPTVLLTGQPSLTDTEADARWADVATALTSDAAWRDAHIVAALVENGEAGDAAFSEVTRRYAGVGLSPELHIHVATVRDAWSGGPCLGAARRSKNAVVIDPSVSAAEAVSAVKALSAPASEPKEVAKGVWQCPVQLR